MNKSIWGKNIELEESDKSRVGLRVKTSWKILVDGEEEVTVTSTRLLHPFDWLYNFLTWVFRNQITIVTNDEEVVIRSGFFERASVSEEDTKKILGLDEVDLDR